MKEKTDIRKCIESDVSGTGRFYDSVVLWLNDHINYPRWIYRVYPGEQSVRTMTEAGTQYICVKGCSVIGAFVLNDDPQGNYQKGEWSRKLVDGSYMVIHALAVDPTMQRKGMGTENIRFCVEKAKAEGYKAVRVDIVPTNKPSRRMFEKNGFRYIGDVDLDRDVEGIPAFSLYELNLP